MNDFFARDRHSKLASKLETSQVTATISFYSIYFNKINISSSLIYRSSAMVSLFKCPLWTYPDIPRFNPKLTTMVQTWFDQAWHATEPQ